jgi:hypothetical protein
MQHKILDRIRDMAYDQSVTFEDIDQFVDECIEFLMREATPELNFKSDIYELENARQNAILIKLSITPQR